MNINKGITYIHEHITINLSGVKKDDDCKLDTFAETVAELKTLKTLGVENIVDVTNRGMGRKIDYLLKVQAETGLNILCSTGYYKEPFFPEEVYQMSIKQLVDVMVGEICKGIDGSSIKASAIGEIGTGNEMSLWEKKVFCAAAGAHVETGRPIFTHTTLGRLGMEQIMLLESYGVTLEKVLIGHVDLSGDVDYILQLIDKGVYVGFDTIGKANYLPDERRVTMLKEICTRGLSERVMLSMDITRKSHLKARGGLGYEYLLKQFVPMLKESGVAQSDIDNMLINNAVRFFTRK